MPLPGAAVRSPRRIPTFVPRALAMLALSVAAPAWAATVEGEIQLPPAGVEEPPLRLVGFVNRIKNPVTELRPFDPRPECFVYLEGGPAGPDASTPTKTVYLELGSVSFLTPILPVVVGTNVEIKNVGKNTHPIQAVGHPGLFEGPPVGPGGVRSSKITTANVAIRLASPDSPHVEGRIVALKTRYFSRIARDGTFRIDDVPPGRWTLKIWYRDGWLPTTQTVEVSAKAPRIKITLPERLEPKAPVEAAEGGK